MGGNLAHGEQLPLGRRRDRDDGRDGRDDGGRWWSLVVVGDARDGGRSGSGDGGNRITLRRNVKCPTRARLAANRATA